MSNWLDFSGNSNLFKQVYIKGFVDISGGDFIARNGNLRIARDSSLNGNVVIGKDLTVLGRMSVLDYTQQKILNVSTTIFNLYIIHYVI
jgi:hypothetical protein